MLGIIRICCGLMVLYVHFAYSYDFQTLFGNDAWVNLDRINGFRLEMPWAGPPTGWDPLVIPPAHIDYERDYLERWGVHPNQAMAHGQPLWSIWFHVTDPTAMWVAHGCILTSMFLFTIGFFHG